MSFNFDLQPFVDPFLVFLADDPVLRVLQGGIFLAGAIAVYLVFFATRDILTRTHSFWYMLACIVLTAALPVVGFFLYLLIRPVRTIREREIHRMLSQMTGSKKQQKQS